jgi:general secretion pathway protein G
MSHKKLSKFFILFLVFQIFACRNYQSDVKSREAVLRENLDRIRAALDQHYSDHGKYPSTLRELVRRGYFKKIQIDPITRRDDTWILVNSESGIQEIHSGAEGTDLTGTPTQNYEKNS